MHILYLSQYFPPEVGATQTRAYEMACGLVQAGHHVTMIAEVPNHPSGIVPPAYRRQWYERSDMDGIDVLRVWVKAAPVKTFKRRMALYLSYMANATLVGALKARGPFEVVYATSPPLFTGAAGLALHWLKRAPFVFEVRDLWPESAVALGELSSPRAIAWASRLEELCYNRAARIVVVTAGIRQQILARGYPADRLALIPNGANTELFRPQPKNLALRQRLGIANDDFVVVFTGLHGLAHGLETALQAAQRLRHEPGVRFLFVGDGPQKPALVQMARQLDLTNLLFLDAVPEAQLPAILAAADVGLDTRRRLEISRSTLPVKMFSYMACGLPVLLAIEGEAADLLAQAQAGVVAPPEDPAALAEAILALRTDSDRLARFAVNGPAFVQAYYSRQSLARRLEQVLEQVLREENNP